jgi:hypothetical protein
MDEAFWRLAPEHLIANLIEAHNRYVDECEAQNKAPHESQMVMMYKVAATFNAWETQAHMGGLGKSKFIIRGKGVVNE